MAPSARDLPVFVYVEDALEYERCLYRTEPHAAVLFGPTLARSFGPVTLRPWSTLGRLPSRSIFASWSSPWFMNATSMWCARDQIGQVCLVWTLFDGLLDSVEFAGRTQNADEFIYFHTHVLNVFGT